MKTRHLFRILLPYELRVTPRIRGPYLETQYRLLMSVFESVHFAVYAGYGLVSRPVGCWVFEQRRNRVSKFKIQDALKSPANGPGRSVHARGRAAVTAGRSARPFQEPTTPTRVEFVRESVRLFPSISTCSKP